MYAENPTALSSLMREAQIGNITVPDGDRGEQLIACLILSIIAEQLHTLESARAYVAQAHVLAEGLSRHAVTYCPPHPSKFASVICEAEGETETLLLSVINGILVMPVINPQDIAKYKLPAQPTITLRNVEVAYFKLRLRPARLARALQPLMEMTSAEAVAIAADGILRRCLSNEITATEPVGIAGDYLKLSNNFIKTFNFPLAKLAIQKADSALERYVETTPAKTHPEWVRQTQEEIRTITKALTDGGN